MKVVFCIPAMEGGVKTSCHQSLVATYRALHEAKIPYDEFFVENCPYLPVARATLAAMFMLEPGNTDAFFIDSDVGFDPAAVVAILQRQEGIVGGTYPLKRDILGFTAEVLTEDGIPIGRDGLIEAKFLPGGFMRVKRIVFEKLAEAYPELKYESSVVEVMGSGITTAYDFFGMGAFGRRFRTEDYAFCQRWRDIGGQLWVYPNIDFQHVGQKAYKGNYHEFLLRQPGGLASQWNLESATAIPGWMNLEECIWLAEHAAKHKRIVELGSWYGRSTRAMADNTEGVIFAVDHWQGSPEMHLSAEQKNKVFGEFSENLKDHIESGCVRPITLGHEECAMFRPGQDFDMVFIDGDHSCEAVLRDIRIWKERIEPGGLLCGHDANWPGVERAVRGLLPGALVAERTNIWYWQAPGG
mgnify:CR=1 FL=1